MHKEDTQVLVRALATFTLAGHDLPVIEYCGQPVMFARNVAESLGYEDANKLGEYIGGKWRDRLREGTDYVRLTGDDLAALKAADIPSVRGNVDPQARSVVLLTEAGAQVAAMLSRTKVGDRVRWEIVDTLIPAIRRLAAPTDRRAALLDAAGDDASRWAIVLSTDSSRERHALWCAATELRKAEIKAADSLYVAEQERRRNEMLIQRRVRVELNQQERRRLVGKLVAEMRDEIEDRRAGKRKVREVADLAGKTWAVIADDRYGQGTEPVLLRDTLN